MAFELKDMKIEEVSLVDKAANQRVFLVVKSEVATPVADGAVAPEAPATVVAEETVAPPVEPVVPVEPAPVVEAAKADVPAEVTIVSTPPKIRPSAKKALRGAYTKLREQIDLMMTELEKAEEADDATRWVPWEFSEPLCYLKALIDATEDLIYEQGSAEGEINTAAAAELAKAYSEEMRVSKVGRKMARGRMNKFKQAVEMLAGLVKELDEEVVEDAACKKNDEPDLSKTVAELTGTLAKQTEEIAGLQAKVKSQEELLSRPGQSNALPHEEAQSAPKAEVIWETDLARTVS